MNFLDVLVEELYNNDKEIKKSDIPDGFGIPTTPVVSYFCFNESLDIEYYKDEVLKEEILEERKKSVEKTAMQKAKKEMKDAKKGRTSKETGTVYKLTKEQKRALRYIKKKYGKEIVDDVKKFRLNFLAPYQVIKSNLNKSKSIYPKEVLGMSKEEYLRAKKRAEYKIENMRSDKYRDLNIEYSKTSSAGAGIDEIISLGGAGINNTALRRVFEKYKLSSKRFSDSDFKALQNKIDNREVFAKSLLDKISEGGTIGKEDLEKLKRSQDVIDKTKRKMVSTYRTTKEKEEVKKIFSSDIDNLDFAVKKIENLEKDIEDLNIPEQEKKEALEKIKKYVSIKGERINNATFINEYELFLLRDKIRKQIESGEKNKYVEEYLYQLGKTKERNIGRKEELLRAMTRERLNKRLTDEEKKIYELKKGAPRDSDKLEDYILKIKEDDFFDPIFFSKTDKMKDAERKMDAEIKRFERALQSKMEDKDFKLLKKYNLINNLVTVKDLKGVKELIAKGEK